MSEIHEQTLREFKAHLMKIQHALIKPPGLQSSQEEAWSACLLNLMIDLCQILEREKEHEKKLPMDFPLDSSAEGRIGGGLERDGRLPASGETLVPAHGEGRH